jgi:hypothetical protein
MDGLPALLTRPVAVLPAAQPRAAPDSTTSFSLDNGVPARIPLSGDRVLVLSVGLGRARALLASDPASVVVTAGTTAVPPADPLVLRDPDVPIARLSLLEGAALGDSVPVVVGIAVTLSVSGRSVIEVTIDAITLTAGSLRSPGQYGSSVTLRWRDLPPAGNAGPQLATGDDSIPRPRLLAYRRMAKQGVA